MMNMVRPNGMSDAGTLVTRGHRERIVEVRGQGIRMHGARVPGQKLVNNK
jgi:hypothetical protein